MLTLAFDQSMITTKYTYFYDMRNILFIMAQYSSHFNASFKLAKVLQNKGYTITYLCSGKHAEVVQAQGFAVCEISIKTLQISRRKLWWTNLLKKIKSKHVQGIIKRLYRKSVLVESIRQIVDMRPSLVLADSMVLLCFFTGLLRAGVPVVTIHTKVSAFKSSLVPPPSCRLLPGNTLVDRFLIRFAWRKHLAERAVQNWWRRMANFNKDDHSLSMRIARKYHGFPIEFIHSDRAFNCTIRQLPEILLSPREFDFPRASDEHQIYAGAGVDLLRNDGINDEQYAEFMRVTQSQQFPLIYCSLGTVSTLYRKRAFRFLKRVIAASRNQPFTLVMTLGEAISSNQFKSLPPNVHLFKVLPQLEVLKHADVMITHGGMNSIKECILHEVPMLAYPLNNKWDQPGNSARVIYHGLGLRGDIQSESSKTILRKIMQLLSDESYQQNVKKMKRKIIAGDRHEEVANMIDAIIGSSSSLKQTA